MRRAGLEGIISVHPYRRLFDRACRSLRGGTLAVDFWDGSHATYGAGEPRVRLKIHRAAVVLRLAIDPELAFGEAYMRGELEIEGRLDDLMKIAAANDAPAPALVNALFHGAALFSRWKPLSMRRNRRDVSRHYDLGNDFYKLWLDATMTYSCAYFRSPDDDLETAQRQKMSHVLNKLMLQPGESLLDIGCGWGSLVYQAAADFGARALGITLSQQQKEWFDGQGENEGNAVIELKHYHELARQGGRFDKIVSVGMAEHVGRHRLPGYIADVKKLLRPGGLGLLHFISSVKAEPTSPWIVKYIFPGGYIPSLSEVVGQMARHDLVICDVENLGAHYALTLDRWAENFERHTDWVEARYGAEFVRMWRLYLNFSAASFRCEDIYVHQILFCNGKPHLPLTREHLYPSSRAIEYSISESSKAAP